MRGGQRAIVLGLAGLLMTFGPRASDALIQVEEEVAPPFGHEMRSEFMIAPNLTQMNHGAYGATPKKVFAAQVAYMKEMEADIQSYMRDSSGYRGGLIVARNAASKYINAEPEDVVIVDNASNGINVLLRDWTWTKDSVLIDLSTAYGPFKEMYKWLAAFKNVKVVTAKISFPLRAKEDVINAVRATLKSIPMSSKTESSVLVVSQISSVPAVVMPTEEIVQLARESGITVIVDGAHALGNIPVDIKKIDPDFWFGNGHKWLFAPKSACILYARKKFQSKLWPQPTVVDTYDDSFVERFVWDGTRDRSPFLAVRDALDFREWAGGDVAIRGYVDSLSKRGAALLAQRWNTSLLVPESMTSAMSNVIVPTKDIEQCNTLGDELQRQYGIILFSFLVDGICFVRVHAQIYLEIGDYDFLANATLDILGK